MAKVIVRTMRIRLATFRHAKYCLTTDSDVNIVVTMATEHILSLLIAERDKLSKAIEALGGAPKPAASPKVAEVSAPAAAAPAKTRHRKPLTAAQKKAHSERMKAFWAARRKKQAKG
jgi:hypothetical protein